MDPGTILALDGIIQLVILIVSRQDAAEPTAEVKADSTRRLNASVGRLQQIVKDKYGDA